MSHEIVVAAGRGNAEHEGSQHGSPEQRRSDDRKAECVKHGYLRVQHLKRECWKPEIRSSEASKSEALQTGHSGPESSTASTGEHQQTMREHQQTEPPQAESSGAESWDAEPGKAERCDSESPEPLREPSDRDELDELVGPGELVGQYVRVRRVRHGRGVEVCEISGELDLFTAPIAGRELDSAAEQGLSGLVVDMSGVTFCSVAGVELLLRAAASTTDGGGLLAVVAGRQVRRVVRLVAPDGPIAWFDSVCDAVDHTAGDRNISASGMAGIDLDSTQRGLRRYVEIVAAGLGLEAAAAWSDVDDVTATAYIALDGELPGMEGREVALVWDGRTGWAVGAETHSGEDLMIRSWYGTELLPGPDAVVRFVRELTAGRRVGLEVPPEPSGQPDAAQIVRSRLQAAAWSDREPHRPGAGAPNTEVSRRSGASRRGGAPSHSAEVPLPREGVG